MTDLEFELLESLVISDCRPPMIEVPDLGGMATIADYLEDLDFSGNQLTTASVEGSN